MVYEIDWTDLATPSGLRYGDVPMSMASSEPISCYSSAEYLGTMSRRCGREGRSDVKQLLEAGCTQSWAVERKHRDRPFSAMYNAFRVASSAPRLCPITEMLTSSSLYVSSSFCTSVINES